MRWELDSESGNLKQRQYKTKSFDNMVMSYFQRVKPQCEVESFDTTAMQKKMTHTVLMALAGTATLCLKLWDDNTIIVHVKKLVHLSLRKNFNEALKRES